VGEAAGFSLHAGVATKANERTKLERLCRYITEAGGIHKTSVIDPQWPDPLWVENTLAQWHYACHI